MAVNDRTRGFVVLSAPRSGSTWLVDLLNRTTRATVHAELFIRRRKPRAERLMTPETAEHLDANLRSYPLFCELTGERSGIRPADFPEVWAFVVWHRLPVLHLVRRNHLDVYISSEIRDATGAVHSLVGEPEPTTVQIEPNTADLLRALRRSRRNIQIARLLLGVSPVRHLEIHYEDLLQDRRSLEAACDFLHLALESPLSGSRLRKLVMGSHRQVIKNYAEVSNALQGTEFEGLLR
jgi:LPS sulfotransferase NodH